MPLREYVDSLDGVAKSRYFDKLKVLGLAAIDDPYASGDFQNAMRLWPPVKFNGRRSKRTTVEVWDLRNSSQCVILKDLVTDPSSSLDNAHRPWVATKKD